MNLFQSFLTQNECYKIGKTLKPRGVMVHSTGSNNPNIRRYAPSTLAGRNSGANHWNQLRPGGRQVCVHAFVGKLADGSIGTAQTLPWTMRGWHCGGKANDTHIGFEICEDGLEDPAYFATVYREAVELTAYLCKTYGLDPLKDGVVICHSEGHKRGIASNHADVMHWFPRHGKNMDTFRADVVRALKGEDEELTEKEIRAIVRDEYARIEAERAALPVPDWAVESGEHAAAVAAGITDGTRPMAPATRLEAAVMIERAKKQG